MVFMDYDGNQTYFMVGGFGSNVSNNHEAVKIKNFIEENYKYLDDEVEKMKGRPAYRKTSLLSVMFYAEYDGIDSLKKISEYCEANKYYNYLTNGYVPSERTLQRFMHDYGEIYNEIKNKIVLTAEEEGYTSFNHIMIDGTIMNGNNNKYNVIKQKDIDELFKILSKIHTKTEIESFKDDLSRTAYKILINEIMTRDEKLEYLKHLENQLKKSGQSSIGLNDYDARWMHNKKGLKDICYNMQSAVDYDSKMIVSWDIVQDPTDHHQLPHQLDLIKETIGRNPDKISADTGYHTDESLLKLHEEGIDGYIPTRKQAKAQSHRLSTNPYHKDNFKYSFETDSFICPEGQELLLKGEYKVKSKDTDYPDKIKRVYYNKDCYNCELKDKCTKSNVRVITDYGDTLKKSMERKMETKEGKEEYSKRKVVEAPFGVLKKEKGLDCLPVTGIDQVKNRVSLKVCVYNWKRLEKLRNGEADNPDSFRIFCNHLKRRYPFLKFRVTVV